MGDRFVRGSLRRVSSRMLKFNPRHRLRNKTRYKVIVFATRDRLGNRGEFFASTFRT
jgi:hypothetical protein